MARILYFLLEPSLHRIGMKNVVEYATWTPNRKHLIKACEKYAYPLAAGALSVRRAEVMVFRGDPMLNRRREIFYTLSH